LWEKYAGKISIGTLLAAGKKKKEIIIMACQFALWVQRSIFSPYSHSYVYTFLLYLALTGYIAQLKCSYCECRSLMNTWLATSELFRRGKSIGIFCLTDPPAVG
jgi:hypothetical protein